MNKTYILVANSSQANLYSTYKAKLFNGGNPLNLVDNLFHPASRKKTSELVADRAGRNDARIGPSSTYNEPTDPHEYEAHLFAKEVADDLEKHYQQNKFQDLIIAAPPKFHGALNRYLKNNMKNIVSLNIEKDYTRLSSKELLNHLLTYL